MYVLFTYVGEAQVRLHLPDVSKPGPGVCRRHTRRHNDIVARRPVNGRHHALPVAQLQAVDDPQHLGRVPARARRVQHRQPDLLRGVNDEDSPDREGDGPRRCRLVQLVLRDHVVQIGDGAVGVGDDGELHLGVAHLVDVVDPLVVLREVVGALTACCISLRPQEGGRAKAKGGKERIPARSS